jgi:hypothetical protein
MTEDQPIWAGIIFSLVPLVMGLVILGAWFGIVSTDGGSFRAPGAVIISLAVGLILFAAAVWIPGTPPKALRLGVTAILLLLVAVVCNWTAFAPGIRHTSDVMIGPRTSSGEDQVGGRIAFAAVAVGIDAILAIGLLASIRHWLPPK